MDLKQIKQLVSMVEGAKISHLSIEVENMKIEIKKELNGHHREAGVAIPHVQHVAVPVAHEVEGVRVAEVAPKSDDSHLLKVKAQMVGTFYASSSPEAPAYVRVGDRIKKGQIVCIIEAMKLFNEIESDIEGVVEKVLVENGNPVEYGQALFLVRPE